MSIERDLEKARSRGDTETVEMCEWMLRVQAQERRAKAQARVPASQLQLDMLRVARQRRDHLCSID